MKSSSEKSLTVRPWVVKDAAFVCRMRNSPRLMEWFRQDKPITLVDQERFILEDGGRYNGRIIEDNGEPVGVRAVKGTGELCLVLDEKYHPFLAQILPDEDMWGEVFVGNPLLKWLIMNDFSITGVREHEYYKKNKGFIDIVKVERNAPQSSRSAKVCKVR